MQIPVTEVGRARMEERLRHAARRPGRRADVGSGLGPVRARASSQVRRLAAAWAVTAARRLDPEAVHHAACCDDPWVHAAV